MGRLATASLILPNAPEIYAFDKRMAEVCRQMSIDGFRFDVAQADKLRSALDDRYDEARARCEGAIGRPLKSGKTGSISTKDLRKAFFDEMGAPVYYRSEITGRPALDATAMRAYAMTADDQLSAAALAVLDMRRAEKITSYLDVDLDVADRVHPSWLNYGAVSGRFSCQAPNLQNLPTLAKDPTAELGGIRSCYVPRKGFSLVWADAKQLEMRVAAYLSQDPVMIRACESTDLHTANAKILFGKAFDEAAPIVKKGLRTRAKSSGFAVCYMAEAKTVWERLVAEGIQITLRQVEVMLLRLKANFNTYYNFQAIELRNAAAIGYVATPILGRVRWLGAEPLPTECANHPIQGGAADFINIRLLELLGYLPTTALRPILVAQVHDSVVFEIASKDAEDLKHEICGVFEKPIRLRNGREPVFPMDPEIGERWS